VTSCLFIFQITSYSPDSSQKQKKKQEGKKGEGEVEELIHTPYHTSTRTNKKLPRANRRQVARTVTPTVLDWQLLRLELHKKRLGIFRIGEELGRGTKNLESGGFAGPIAVLH
jgi:hypothetical protein